MHKCRHIVCKVHAGLGVGMASGSPSGADKNIHKSPQAKSVYDGEREGNGEGLFNWWWIAEEQREERMRGKRKERGERRN